MSSLVPVIRLRYTTKNYVRLRTDTFVLKISVIWSIKNLGAGTGLLVTAELKNTKTTSPELINSPFSL